MSLLARRIASGTLSLALLTSSLGPLSTARAGEGVGLPEPGTVLEPTAPFQPFSMRGIVTFPEDPLRFEFVMQPGDSSLGSEDVEPESRKLIQYFLTALTIPESDIWVNLSPGEADRVIPESLGQTAMGRTLLEQDYLLKQMTASLLYPERELGQAFWQALYTRVEQRYGTREVPLDLVNRVWIVPRQAVVYTSADRAYIGEARLQVLLERDYLARQADSLDGAAGAAASPAPAVNRERDGIVEEITRDIILPELEREVNEGKTFAGLRQVYHAAILAAWFKRHLRDSLLGQAYAEQGKLAGIVADGDVPSRQIYDQYMRLIKEGAFHYIREEYDAVTKTVVPRKYLAGGIKDMGRIPQLEERDLSLLTGTSSSPVIIVGANLHPEKPSGGVSSPAPVASITQLPSAESLTVMRGLGDLDLRKAIFVGGSSSHGLSDLFWPFCERHFYRPGGLPLHADYASIDTLVLQRNLDGFDREYQLMGFYVDGIVFDRSKVQEQLRAGEVREIRSAIQRLRDLTQGRIPIVLYLKGEIAPEVREVFGTDLYYYSEAEVPPNYRPENFLSALRNEFRERQISARLSLEDAETYRLLVKNKGVIASDILRAGVLLRNTYDSTVSFLENIQQAMREYPGFSSYQDSVALGLFAEVFSKDLAAIERLSAILRTADQSKFPIAELRELQIPANDWWAELFFGESFVDAFEEYLDFEAVPLADLVEYAGARTRASGQLGEGVIDPREFSVPLEVLEKIRSRLAPGAYHNIISQLSFAEIFELEDFSAQQDLTLGAGYHVRLLPDVIVPELGADKRFVLTFVKREKLKMGDRWGGDSLEKQRAAFDLLADAEEINDRLLAEMMRLGSLTPPPKREDLLILLTETEEFLGALDRIMENAHGKDGRQRPLVLGEYRRQLAELETLVESQDERSPEWPDFVARMLKYREEEVRIHSLIHHVHQDVMSQSVLSWIGMRSFWAQSNREMRMRLVDQEGNLSRSPRPDDFPEGVAIERNIAQLSYWDFSADGIASEGVRDFLHYFLSRLVGMRFVPSDRYRYKAVVSGEQICLYLGVDNGLHVPLVYVHLGDPALGGKVSVRWNDSLDKGGDLRNILISKILQGLDFSTQSSELMTVGTYGGNSQIATSGEIESRALIVATLLAMMTNVDMFLHNQGKTAADVTGIAEDLLGVGGLSVQEIMENGRPNQDLQVVAKLIARLNDQLTALGLPTINGERFVSGDRFFGQAALDQYFNRPVQGLLDRHLAVVGSDGKLRRQTEYKEPDTSFAVTSGIATAPAISFDRARPPESYRGMIVVADRLKLDDIVLIEHAAGLVTTHGNATGHLAINIAEMHMPWVVTREIPPFEDGTLCWVDGNRGEVSFGDQSRKQAPALLDDDYLNDVLLNVSDLSSLEELFLVFAESRRRLQRTTVIPEEGSQRLQEIYARILIRVRALRLQIVQEAERSLLALADKNGSLDNLAVGEVDDLIRIQKKMARAFGDNRPPVYGQLKTVVDHHKKLFQEDYQQQFLFDFQNGGKIVGLYAGNKGSKLVETQNMLKRSPFSGGLYFTKGFLISDRAFNELVRSTNNGFSLNVPEGAGGESWGDLIRTAPFPQVVGSLIMAKYEELFHGARVSVRSSSLIEDKSDFSFAGMASSLLNVDRSMVLSGVREVWASFLNKRAIDYMRRNKLSVEDVHQGQIVQEMVEADVSGVLRTVNPNAVHKNVMVAEMVYGLGPGVVEDTVGSDRIEISKTDDSFTLTVGEKTEMLVSDWAKPEGIKKVAVGHRRAIQPSLSRPQIKLLTDVAKYIEDYYGYPVDIEFCFKDNKLTILQVRPLSPLFENGATDYSNDIRKEIAAVYGALPGAVDLDTRIQEVERALSSSPVGDQPVLPDQERYGGIALGFDQGVLDFRSEETAMPGPGRPGDLDPASLLGLSPMIFSVVPEGNIFQAWGLN